MSLPRFQGQQLVRLSLTSTGILLSVFLVRVVTLVLFDRSAWIAFATSLPVPQQAGIPCIFIALAAAAGELKLASNSRYESAELRARAADETGLPPFLWTVT